jgi:hypothetical protein
MRNRQPELTLDHAGIMIGQVSLKRILSVFVVLLVSVLLLGSSSVPAGDQTESVRAFTRQIEFNYVDWTLNAIKDKLYQLSLGTARYLPQKLRNQTTLEYLELVMQIQRGEAALREMYTDPNITDPEALSAPFGEKMEGLYSRRELLAPLAESILQDQVSQVVADMGLTLGGQPVPPVMYRVTPLPMGLVVSPRNTIRQDDNIPLLPDLTLDEQVALEEQVSEALDVSTLVVGIGGVGVYPTMVMQSTDLNWLAEVVAHEWIHNFLSLRPLGLNYLTSPELRTMNETAASIAGKEIGRELIARYYPELLPPPPAEPPAEPAADSQPPEEPVFDYRAEMRETRVEVDRLLAEGKVEEAEQYMEQRRVFFWENGYPIRKLNQAYFAFYGAYADEPGGAAGEDPVGAAVRRLRADSPSLAHFLKRIAWMSSYKQLQHAVTGSQPGN